MDYGDYFSRRHTAIAVGLVASTVVLWSLSTTTSAKARRAKAKLPPGPERNLLLGNLLNFPKKAWYATFTRWKEEYGDLIYAKILNKDIIICNSLEVAEELGGKRGNIYSGRSSTNMEKLLYLSWTTVLSPPGHHHNEQRKMLRRAIGPQAVHEYDQIIQASIAKIHEELAGFSGNPYPMLAREMGAIIIKTAFGEKVFNEHGDELVETNDKRGSIVTKVTTQFWFVNIFSLLRYIPPWFPGAGFRRLALEGRRMGMRVRYGAFSLVERNMANGVADESIVTKYINEPEVGRDHLRDVVGSLYMAGFDTTASAMANFLYSAMVHSSVQKKLHKELDEHVGGGRMPSMAEIEKLEYLNAAWNESLRWIAPVPLGIPHSNTEEDVWNGYYIPKDSLIFFNIGCMLRDPELFGDDANDYNPNRFLPAFNPRAKELPDMSTIPFGFGKRICPGRYLAERICLMISAAILSAYDLVPVNADASPSTMEFRDALVRRPLNFQCRFVPRHHGLQG